MIGRIKVHGPGDGCAGARTLLNMTNALIKECFGVNDLARACTDIFLEIFSNVIG